MAKLFGNANAVSKEDLNSDTTAVTVEAPEQQVTEKVEPQNPEPKVTETVTQETAPAQETVETPTEKPVETQTEEIQTEVKDPSNPTPTFDITVLNKTIETNFESVEDLKARLDKASKVDEYEPKIQELDTLKEKQRVMQEEYDILLEESNPANLFGEEEYKLAQYKKQFPDKDPATAQSIFTQEDLKNVDDFEIVKWGYKLDNPKLKGGEEGIKQTVADELGIDPDLDMDEWPIAAQNKLHVKANQFRKDFNDMRNIEVPKTLDVQTIRQQRQEAIQQTLEANTKAWNEAKPKIEANLNKLELPVGVAKEGEQQEVFTWDLGSVPQDKVNDIVDRMVQSGQEVNQESLDTAKQAVRLSVIQEQLPQILSKYKESLTASLKEEHLKQTHNPNPLTDTQRSDSTSEQEKKDFNEWAKPQGGYQRRGLFNKQ